MSILTPSKHTNLRYSIFNVAAHIIKILKDSIVIEYDVLLNILKQDVGDEVGDVFLLSISFLFIHKKIEYNQKSDLVRLVRETV